MGRAKRGRLKERILENVREIKNKKRSADKFSIITTRSVREAKRLETKLIKKRKPPFNIERKGK